METTQSPQVDILRNRANLLTLAVEKCNQDLCKIDRALHLFLSERVVYQVKVLDTDEFREVVDVVFFGTNNELDAIVATRLRETQNSVSSNRTGYLTELSGINQQLAAMGSSDNIG